MIYKAKFGLLSNITKLMGKASIQDFSYFYDFCDVLVSELDLYAAVLFKHVGNNNFKVLGKSKSAKSEINDSDIYSCRTCRLLNQKEYTSFNSDPKCEIGITEILTYESCSLFKDSNSEEFLLKLAKKSPFSNEDKSSIKVIIEFLQLLLNIKPVEGKISSNDLPTNTSKNEIFINAIGEVKKLTNSIVELNSIFTESNLTLSQKELLNNIRKSGKELQILFSNLSELLSLSEDNSPKKEIAIKPMLEEIVELFNNKKDSNGNSFSFDINSKYDFRIFAVDRKLRFIISTLFSICDAFTQNGKIICKIELQSENIIAFTISDSSSGIPESKRKFLTETFALNGITELAETNLNGLSYQLTEKYVKEIGGELDYQTGDGGGTKFSFNFIGKIKTQLENDMKDLPEPGKNSKVLLIEDDYATIRLLTNYLQKWGYDPVVVNTAEDTLNKIKEQKFLAAILDIEIPDCNGLELLKKIHESPGSENLPVIVSSVAHEEQKAFMLGAVEYFVKPIDYKFLVQVLQNYKLRSDSKVLCVDDDLSVLNMLKDTVENAGFIPVAENVSANVMDRISGMNIDLAIIDLDMPNPNGFELIKLIKSEPGFSKLPIIIYTGKQNYQEDLKSIDGMFESLLEKKSTSFENLAEVINGMINRYETLPPAEEIMEKKDNVVKILLAEDYKHSQIIVTRMLKKNGFENIIVVENGQEALNYARKEKFNLILMDMQMPIMNGFESTQKIREIPEYKSTPIIALTAFAMKGDREKCIDAGATDYIPKPIDGKEFIEKVKQYTS